MAPESIFSATLKRVTRKAFSKIAKVPKKSSKVIFRPHINAQQIFQIFWAVMYSRDNVESKLWRTIKSTNKMCFSSMPNAHTSRVSPFFQKLKILKMTQD